MSEQIPEINYNYVFGKGMSFTTDPVGEDEGDLCRRDFCTGHLVINQEPCYCSACRMPPCSNCEHGWMECTECDWRSDE